VPSDVRRQLERSIKDGQKTLKTAIDQLQLQVRRTAKQADVEKALKRLDGLSKQVQDLARAAAARRATTSRRTASTARRAKTTVKRTTRKAATTARRAASTATRTAKRPVKRTVKKAAPAKRTATRAAARPATRRAPARQSSPAAQDIRYVPPAPEPGPVPERVDSES
jgi:hypothetical protein